MSNELKWVKGLSKLVSKRDLNKYVATYQGKYDMIPLEKRHFILLSNRLGLTNWKAAVGLVVPTTYVDGATKSIAGGMGFEVTKRELRRVADAV